MTLTEEANNIMMQARDAVTPDDIYKLRQIVRQMTKAYHEYNRLAWKEEYDYNLLRAKNYVGFKNQSKKSDKKYTETEMERSAKFYAENEHWKRREHRNTAKSMYATIEAINNYIITYHTLDKWETQASNHLS